MSRFFVGLALWALLLALAACGSDSKSTDSAEGTEPGEMADTVVSTYDDLTVCTDKREGTTAYVEDEKKAYVYKNGFWVVDDSLTKEIESDLEKKSSDGKSNSSGKNNSSNPDVSTVSLASPCKTATEDNCEYGTLTDDRDGQTYKTVKIGEHWWMAVNLRYWGHGGVGYVYENSIGGFVHASGWNVRAFCEEREKYGCSYFFDVAMDSAGSGNGEGCGYLSCYPFGYVRGICPKGWHLPDTSEWKALFSAVGGDTIARINLKSDSGWKVKSLDGAWKEEGNGTDGYGFNVIPTPSCRLAWDDAFTDYMPKCNEADESTSFWSYSLDGDCFGVLFSYYDNHFGLSSYCTSTGDMLTARYNRYVRCIMDSESASPQIQISSNSPAPKDSVLTDERDGQTYKVVKIGKWWWMAENLNYRYIQQTAEEDSSSYCYDNDPVNCAKYGRLYLWSAALDSAGIIPGNTANGCGYSESRCISRGARGVCPEGWYLPGKSEWEDLFLMAGREGIAGKLLKSTEGWIDRNEETSGNGVDRFGFSALPAGRRNANGEYENLGSHAYIWSTEANFNSAYEAFLSPAGVVRLSESSMNGAYSVRCVREY